VGLSSTAKWLSQINTHAAQSQQRRGFHRQFHARTVAVAKYGDIAAAFESFLFNFLGD
jgi:hypothetical protein